MLYSSRMVRRLAHFTTIAVLSLMPAFARGQEVPQEVKNYLAYLALSITPPGALPPLVTRSMLGPASTGTSAGSTALRPQLAVRFGRATYETDSPGENVHANTYAVTGMLSAGEAATLSGTVGILDPTCAQSDCDGQWIFSVGGDLALAGAQLGAESGSPRLTMGVNGEIGYTKKNDIDGLGLTAGVPIALVTSSGGMKVVPFLIPAIGYGRSKVDVGEQQYGAMRFLLGGGVSLLNIASALSVNVGFQKIFFSADTGFGTISSRTLFGVSATLGR